MLRAVVSGGRLVTTVWLVGGSEAGTTGTVVLSKEEGEAAVVMLLLILAGSKMGARVLLPTIGVAIVAFGGSGTA